MEDINLPVLSITFFLRSGVDGLPSVVFLRRQIGTLHPHFVPHVEVPYGIAVELLDNFAVAVDEGVDGEAALGVVRRREVGHRPRRDAQRPAH